MKNKFLFSIASIVLFLVSCSSEEEVINESSNLTLNTAIEEIINQSQDINQPVDFEISFLDDGMVRLSEANKLEDSFVSDFSKGFSSVSTNKSSQRTVTVCCTVDGEDQGCTECGDNDGGCVGSAIRKCLDDDGCAEVCNQRIRYMPSLNTFYLLK
ncbi:hypothetical protein [uncultured Dokdonia sp.]|uniref:hypothetical protein n=1 Tax=uncultured Dokdonia sp. TaxID=575653 RepID=UPI00260B437D|nr:hypothetical protein [uncultured Dokdonia sp.]